MIETKEAMSLAVEIGEEMLRNGAEIYRVEDTILHVLEAFEVDEFDVYVLSNGIFASANENKEDACSMIRHVPLGSINLEKITLLNQLARDIYNKKCSIKEARIRLTDCQNLPTYPKWIQVACCGIGSGCFCYLFGGQVIDMVFAFVIGIFEQLLLFECAKNKFSKFITTLIASLFVTALSFVVIYSDLNLMQDKIIIGAIMPLVPGIAFTTSIRDFYNGDHLSGTIHLVDALLTAVCIAIGACLPLFLWT